ncbi:uncharacterized protein SCHCODRAFT_02508764 [Schizophyllum commune H4-8]|nr:uncharacterized protein SCHCODRAFT_02508764 [Schizophyllum commune H4-8]KAI5890767.1 hypothetical protein SCHCODRAFT_02508764 [Schizophyllum commune H4-8]
MSMPKQDAADGSSSDTGSASSSSSFSSATHVTPPLSHRSMPMRALSAPTNADLHDALDLEGSALRDVGDLFEALASPISLPFPPNRIFYKLPQRLYDAQKRRWKGYPDLSGAYPDDEREQLVAAFLDDIHDHCREVLTNQGVRLPDEERRWFATRTSPTNPNDGPTITGAVLVESSSGVAWSNVMCDLQVAGSDDLIPAAVRKLSTTAAYVFATQDDCIYHVGLAFAGDSFTVVVHDRAGRVQCYTRHVHKHGVLLVRLVLAMTLTTTRLGRDPAIIMRPGGTRVLHVNGVEYEILERLFNSYPIRGRGTVCWRCRRPGSDEEYVVKSTWVNVNCEESEVSFLEQAQGVDGIPTLVDHELVVDAQGKPRSTDLFRASLRRSSRQHELHGIDVLRLQRLVMQPLARPLSDFSSKEELLSAIRDAVAGKCIQIAAQSGPDDVAAHLVLCHERGILHNDISENNIMLRAQVSGRLRRGLLIDLDSATYISQPSGVACAGHHLGTLPFMSCSLLLYPGLPHLPIHDLESFLYVLMWICTSYAGPMSARRTGFDPFQSPMGLFSGDPTEVGKLKEEIMYQPPSKFRAFLDDTFDPYFDDLKDCVCEIRRAILFNAEDTTHEDILDILELHACAQQPQDKRRRPVLIKQPRKEEEPPSWWTSDPKWAIQTLSEETLDGPHGDDAESRLSGNDVIDGNGRPSDSPHGGATAHVQPKVAPFNRILYGGLDESIHTCDGQRGKRRSTTNTYPSSVLYNGPNRGQPNETLSSRSSGTVSTTSAVPTPAEAIPVLIALLAVVFTPAATRRLPSRKRKNEAQNASLDAILVNGLHTCESCAPPEAVEDAADDWLCPDCSTITLLSYHARFILREQGRRQNQSRHCRLRAIYMPAKHQLAQVWPTKSKTGYMPHKPRKSPRFKQRSKSEKVATYDSPNDTLSVSLSSSSLSTSNITPPPVHQPMDIHDLLAPANADLHDALNLERTALRDVPNFFHVLTPPTLFPSPPSLIFRDMPLKYFDKKTRRWTGYPDPSRVYPDGERERLVAAFLNGIHDHCREALAEKGMPLRVEERRWLPTRTLPAQSNGDRVSMFGAVLVESNSDVEWSNVLCDVQVASGEDPLPDAVRRLSTTAAYVFATQDDCLYYVGLAFAGDAFAVVMHDRAGRVQCETRHVHRHGHLLVRMVVALTLLDSIRLGRDPAILTRPDGTRLLFVNGIEYEIVERLFISNHLRGRGTVCWRCRKQGSDDDYVIKSTWVDIRREETEITFLEQAQGVDGIPTLVDHEVVVDAEGKARSTDLFRATLRRPSRQEELRDIDVLHLHRLVMQPFAIPLADFSSKEELLSAIRDAVAAHLVLFAERGILHNDISEYNVMLRAQPQGRLRRGLLIDLDSATDIHGPQRTSAAGQHLGTLPFMSFTLLLCPNVPHWPIHDLESFLYVLMWICTSYAGPMSDRQPGFDPYQFPMGQWFSGDPTTVGKLKRDIMFQPLPQFRAFLDNTFDPYFDDLKDCVQPSDPPWTCHWLFAPAFCIVDTARNLIAFISFNMPSIKEIWRDHIVKNKNPPDATHSRRSPRLLAKRRAERATAPGATTSSSHSSYCPAFHRHLSSICPAPILNIANSIEVDGDDALELEKTALWGVIGVTGVITSHGNLYPHSTFLNMPRRLYDHKAFRWARYPRMARTLSDGQREHQVAVFLNEIYDYYRKAMAREGATLPREERRWYTTRSKRRLPDGKYAPVYGVVLTEVGSDMRWKNVLCDVQVADTANLMPDVVRRLSRSAANVFAAQDNCLYHVGVAFAGDEYSVVIHDRAGRVQSLVYKVHRQAGILVRVLCSLSLLDGVPLGRDPTIELREAGKRIITVDEVEYEIVEQLFSSKCVRGAGTICWRCRKPDEEEDYIIKSSWRRAGRSSEASFLKLAGDIDGIPSLIAHEVVTDVEEETYISTDSFRQGLISQGRKDELMAIGYMHLHRLVTQPYARPLCDFTSKEELLSGFRDAVEGQSRRMSPIVSLTTAEAHYRSFTEKKALHCDISEQNIMLRSKNADERIRRGLLIDWDCAAFVRGPRSTAPIGYRTGTAPFMSLVLQTDPSAPHAAHHDLEAFFYVLMWICTYYAGPSCTRRRGYDWRNSLVGQWSKGDLKEIGQRKWNDVCAKSRKDFRVFLDENFHPYFDDLKDCVCDLRQAIWCPKDKDCVTHEDVLDIIAKYIVAQQSPELQRAQSSSHGPAPDTVQGPDRTLTSDESSTAAPPNKRKRTKATSSGGPKRRRLNS